MCTRSFERGRPQVELGEQQGGEQARQFAPVQRIDGGRPRFGSSTGQKRRKSDGRAQYERRGKKKKIRREAEGFGFFCWNEAEQEALSELSVNRRSGVGRRAKTGQGTNG